MTKDQKNAEIEYWMEVPVKTVINHKSISALRQESITTMRIPVPPLHILLAQIGAETQGISYEQASMQLLEAYLQDMKKRFFSNIPKEEQDALIMETSIVGEISWRKNR